MLHRDSAVLVVIDFQEKLVPKIPVSDGIMEQTAQLIRFSRELGVPVLWTEQYPKGVGPTSRMLANELKGFKPIEKMAFGCFDDPNFAQAMEQTGRKQVLITGIEAHVCVMQTAFQAQERGLTPFVVRDAIGSRAKLEYEAGLERMQQAGVALVTTEMAMFEMLRVAGTPEFKRVLPFLK